MADEERLSTLDKLQPFILIASMLLGVLAGNYFPQISEFSDAVVYFTIIILIYSIALGVPLSKVASSYRNLRFFAIAWFMNFVVIPLIAFGLALAFLGPYPAIFVGFILYMVTPCTDWFLMFTAMAKGDVPLGLALLPTNLVLQILLIPVYLLLFAGEIVPFQIDAFIETLLVFILFPFALSWITRRLMTQYLGEEKKEAILGKILSPLQTGVLAVVIFFMFAGQTGVIIDNAGPLSTVFIPVVIFFLVSFMLAQLVSRLTRLNYGECALLTCTTAARNSPLGLAIAIGMFPDEPLIQVAIIIGVLLELPILVMEVKALQWIRKRFYAPATEKVHETGG